MSDGSLSTENENAQLLSLARFSLLRHVEQQLSVTLFYLSRVSLVAFSHGTAGVREGSTSLQLRKVLSAAERSVPRDAAASGTRLGAARPVERRTALIVGHTDLCCRGVADRCVCCASYVQLLFCTSLQS